MAVWAAFRDKNIKKNHRNATICTAAEPIPADRRRRSDRDKPIVNFTRTTLLYTYTVAINYRTRESLS